MTWQRFVVGWVLLSIVAGPLIGRLLRRRRLELEAADMWGSFPKWDVPDDIRHLERVAWRNEEPTGGEQ